MDQMSGFAGRKWPLGQEFDIATWMLHDNWLSDSL